MRIVTRLLFLLPLLWVEGVWAKTCSSYSYELESQGEVIALGNSGCTIISGSLTIGSGVSNLDGLANLVSIGGTLTARGVRNFDGLANLTSIGGSLILENNSADNFDGLANLTSIGGSLTLYSNNTRNLDGLINLTSIPGDLYINYNYYLQNVDGFANLASVGGSITFGRYKGSLDGFANLASVGGNLGVPVGVSDVDGFANLRTVGGELRIIIPEGDTFRGPTNLDGFANVTSLGGLVLTRADSITDVDGFANLSRLGSLYLKDNDALTNLDGLASLDEGLAILINVRGNSALSRCEALAPFLPGKIDSFIGGNATGCSSKQEVASSVSGPTRPVITQASTAGASFGLVFNNSTTTDTLFPITGYFASCTGASIDVSDSPGVRIPDNTPVGSSLFVSGYDETSGLASIEVDISISHPDPTDRMRVALKTPQGMELALWDGAAGPLNGTWPTSLTPLDSLSSVAAESQDGEWVLTVEDIDVGPITREGVLNSWGMRIREEVTSRGDESPIVFTGIGRGRDYTCTVVPETKLKNDPVSKPFTVSVPYEVPTTPSIISTDYEDGKIILTVSVSDTGGTDITGYEANCTTGTNTFTGTSTTSPITVSGLTNDVAYTCTVTATNSVGTSSASAATAPITPEEASTGLPIWLLYQATQ